MPLTPAEIVGRTSLDYWYPAVRDVVPTPKTAITRTEIDLYTLLDGERPDGCDEFLASLEAGAAEVGGYPVFLRTGLTSGKHNWRNTCYVRGNQNLVNHVANLVEFSALADIMGLDTDVWAVRELLPTIAAFHAFEGMPITKERRYFVRDGGVLGWQPYWPPDSIERPDTRDWAARLDKIQTADKAEIAELWTLSAKVSDELPGCWSVDWLWAGSGRGWVLTDMAVGEASFVWEECPTSPDPADLID